MDLEHMKRPSQFGKRAIFLVMVLQVLGPLMHARASDSPIDYANSRCVEEVRMAALMRVDQVIQASMTPVNHELARPVEIPLTEPRAVLTMNSIKPPLAVAEVALNQIEGRLNATRRMASGMDQVEVVPDSFENQMHALADSALNEIRGGFEMPDSGLKYVFGIERAVFVNGELMARTVLHLQDLGSTSGRGVSLQTSIDNAATLGVIQTGPGNYFSAQIGPDMVGTVIQNTLDNQKIQNVTTINASVNSLQVMRAMSVQAAVQSGIIGSLRR